MEQKPWGYHLRIDLIECNRNKITNKKPITDYLKEVLKVIDMKPYGEPQIKRFGENDIEGISFFQFIMTSCIMGHCREDNGHSDLYIDLFSCKEFNVEKAIIFTQGFFKAKKLDFDFKTR